MTRIDVWCLAMKSMSRRVVSLLVSSRMCVSKGGGDKRRAGASRGGIPRLRVTDWSSKRSGAVHIQHGTELSW